MKRSLFVILLVLLLALAASAVAEWATVNNPNASDRLHLRAKPSTSSASYGKYYTGTAVQILEADAGNGFARVRVGLGNGIGELEGYMFRGFLAFGDDQNGVLDMRPVVTLQSPDGSDISLKNFRDGSNMGRVPSGTQVTVLGVGEKNLHVISGSTAGFVPASYATPRLYYNDSQEKRAAAGRTQTQTPAPVTNIVTSSAGITKAALPLCYQKVIIGLGWCYADGAVIVRTLATHDYPSQAIGHLFPGQAVVVETIDEAQSAVSIAYREDGDAPHWDSTDAHGWVDSVFIYNMTDYPASAVVTTDKPGNRLHLRTGPGKGYQSLGKYYAGTVVVKLGERQNGWVWVRIGHTIGWMDGAYLRDGLYTETAELPTLTVTNGSGAMILAEPQPYPKSEAIQQTRHGDTVTLLGVRGDGWYQVVYENEIGYLVDGAVYPRPAY